MHCVLPRKVCIPNNIIKELIPVVKKYKIITNENDAEDVTKDIMRAFRLKEEYNIWEEIRIQEIIGEKRALEILETYYKIKGPYNSNALLSNFDINKIMKQWMNLSNELFKKKFLAIDCQTIDFKQYHNELKNLSTDMILRYDSVGCVLNTDISSGRGKHWICFYIDNKKKEILFFNSSGNFPPMELNTWLHNIQMEFKINNNKNYNIDNVVKHTLQKSRTECGMWCLFFIKSKLLDYQTKWILYQNDMPMMGDFRNLTFR